VNPLFILTADTNAAGGARRGVPVRPIDAADVEELSAMYRDSYADSLPQPPERATGWIDALLAGAEGRHVPEASAVLTGPEGQLTAAIIVTEPAAGGAGDWDSVIAELFTHPGYRRQGLAEDLLGHCLAALQALGRTKVAVTVDSGNSAALALYLSRDFRRLTDDDGD
jgi:ribosomal protein S18 acetylase RimI-like enzyme